MKFRFPLFAKILLCFLINLLVLAVAGWWLSGAPFPPGLDSLLAGHAGNRIQEVSNLISDELHGNPRENWDGILKRFEDAYHVRFYLFANDGVQLAGDRIELPKGVHARLTEPRLLPPEQQPRPPAAGPPPPREMAPDGFPPGASPPPPPLQSNPNGMNPPPQPPPPGQRSRFMMHTSNPGLYWVVVRIAGIRPMADSRPAPASIITTSETISAGGLFFDPAPWLGIGAGSVLFSALLWLPLVKGITRSIGRMTRATEQIAEGRFDVRVTGSRRDELGSLGGAINQMAGRLEGFVGGQKRFLGDIAHELCSPLSRAQIALGILEQRGGEAQLGYIKDVREEIELMSNLVNELLSFSKAALGAQIKLQPVALLPLVEKAAQREKQDDASLRIDVADHLRVMADPELLQRSLANLVRNALHYAGAAGPVVISASEQDGKVILTVADSGPGIPPGALAQVFDPFYRVDPSRARETGGVGLGLAIVKTCAESCGGTVSARNREPSGLEVVITLKSAESHPI